MQRTSATSAEATASDEAGFTLLELLVVLVILALATGWVAFRAGSLIGGGIGVSVDEARRGLAACRTQAMREGRPVRCGIDARALKVGGVQIRDQGLRLTLRGGSSDGAVIFWPSGEASRAQLVLDRGQGSVALDVSPVTGRTTRQAAAHGG